MSIRKSKCGLVQRPTHCGFYCYRGVGGAGSGLYFDLNLVLAMVDVQAPGQLDIRVVIDTR
jgi:hypothetical protein